MHRKANKSIVPFAKDLRKNMTKEERHLWYDFLRNYPLRFYRQKVIGKYILDFYCAKAHLAVELDGSQHYDDAAIQYDNERAAFLEAYHIRVLRIPNNEVNHNFQAVCQYIDDAIQKR